MEQLEVGQALKAAASEILPKMLSTQQVPSASMPPNLTAPAKSSRYRGVTLFRPTLKWRSQISADGKTTSLGDHDTEEQAAIAFDRASINKAGRKAKTNFPLENYANEIDDLVGMEMKDLVAMLRSKAKKNSAQTSHFRGVSMLKQTKKWHAQINVSGKQVHLGFFPTEEFAARAYDRAAINKGAKENTPRIVTNFDITEYAEELAFLRHIPQQELIRALATESKRKPRPQAERRSPQPLQTVPVKTDDEAENEALLKRAEKAHPKATLRNRLYDNFGKKRLSEEDVPSREEGNAADLASNLDSSRMVQSDQICKLESATKEEAGIARQLEAMFPWVELPSTDDNSRVHPPIVDPLTGAPAIIVARDGFKHVNPEDVNHKAFASLTGPGITPESKSATPPKRSSQKQKASTVQQKSENPPHQSPVKKRARPNEEFELENDGGNQLLFGSPIKKRKRSILNQKPSRTAGLRFLSPLPPTAPATPDKRNKLPQDRGHNLTSSPECTPPARTLQFETPTRKTARPMDYSQLGPLTKRQRAIRERDEAAAILAAPQQAQLDDKDNDGALIKFAEIALLSSELEDSPRKSQRKPVRHMGWVKLSDLQEELPKKADSSESDPTEIDIDDQLEQEAGAILHDMQMAAGKVWQS